MDTFFAPIVQDDNYNYIQSAINVQANILATMSLENEHTTSIETSIENIYNLRKKAYDFYYMSGKISEDEDPNCNGEAKNNEDTELKALGEQVNKAYARYHKLIQMYVDTQESHQRISQIIDEFNKLDTMSNKLIKDTQSSKDIIDIPAPSEILNDSYKVFKETLDEKAKQILENINNQQKQIKQFAKIFNTIQAFCGFRVCPICLNNEIEVYLAPCGHTYCKNCSKTTAISCHICKKRVNYAYPLFLN